MHLWYASHVIEIEKKTATRTKTRERQKAKIDKKESKNLKAILKVDYFLYADLTLAIWGIDADINLNKNKFFHKYIHRASKNASIRTELKLSYSFSKKPEKSFN